MFWLPILAVIGAAAVITAVVITVSLIIDKITEWLRGKKQELKQKAIKIVEVKVKQIINQGGKKVVKVGLLGKGTKEVRRFIFFKQQKEFTEDLGTMEFKGDKLGDDIKQGQIIKRVTPEEL